MPLRDHFRPPLDDRTAWEGFHGGWPAVLVQHLNRHLPVRYVAAPRVHSGTQLEFDLATDDPENVGGPAPGIPFPNHVTLTFSDIAAQIVPDSVAPTTGNYKPTNCETPVLSFAPPAPAVPYTEPGCSLIRPVEQTMFGSFGLSDPNGTWSLYVRDDNGAPFAPESVVGSIAGGWGIEFLSPTAAGVEVSGRVMTPDGRGLRNATVTMTNSDGVTLSAVTSSFGYYKFEHVPVGGSFVMNVNSRLYRFTPRVVSVTDTLTDVDFTGLE